MTTHVQNDAPVLLQESVVIHTSPGRIFNILRDIRHWPVWQSSVSRTQLEGAVEKDQPFRYHSGGIATHSHITMMLEPQLFCYNGQTMWFHSSCCWELEESGHGVQVTVEESLNGLGASLLAGTLRNSLRLTLMELKKYAESEVTEPVLK